MKRILFLMLGIIALLWMDSSAERIRYPALDFPHARRSVAAVWGAEKVSLNPATIRSTSAMQMGLYHSFNDSTFNGDKGLIFAKNGIGIAYYDIRLENTESTNSWTVAYGTRRMKKFFLGASYTFYKTDRDDYSNDHIWKLGLLYWPSKNMSIGAVVDNLNRMEFAGQSTKAEYTVGAAIRPSGKRITIAGDYNFYEKERIGDGLFTASVDLRLKDGFWLSGHVDDEGFFGAGISIAFGSGLIEAYTHLEDGGGFNSGVLAYSYNYKRKANLIEIPHTVELTLAGSYPEAKQESFLWIKPGRTFPELVFGLFDLRSDPTISTIVLNISHPRLGWGQREELRREILELRRSGKTVVTFLAPLSSTADYYLASAADVIAMQELDALAITGLSAEITYLKGTLGMIGVTVEMDAIGEYKTAQYIYTADSLSPYHAESANAILDDFFDEITSRISESRSIPYDSLMTIIDNAPVVSQDARELGLVDAVIYRDELDKYLEQSGIRSGWNRTVSFWEYIEKEEYQPDWNTPSGTVSLVSVEGGLVHGSSRDSFISGKSTGSATVNRAIGTALRDRETEAVVLRINSPGGETLGSESIWRTLQQNGIPDRYRKHLVVSMSNVATSGGYHVAVAAPTIIANDMTVTGSIGVYYGKPNLANLRKYLGLRTYHLARGQNAGFLSTKRGFNDTQRERLHSQVELVYERFVNLVADSRGNDFGSVDSLARGRSWTGKAAIEHGLVDRRGGLNDAIDEACRVAGMDRATAEIKIIPVERVSIMPDISPISFLTHAAGMILGFGRGSMSDTDSEDLSGRFYYLDPVLISIH